MRGRKGMILEQKTMSQHHATALGALISDPRFWGSEEPDSLHREPVSHR